MNYNPCDWYWKRQDGRVYSSKKQEFVDQDDADLQRFLDDGGWTTDFPVDDTPERNESEEELAKVLAEYGIELFKPTPEEELHRAKANKKAAIDANTSRIRDRDGLAYAGERFAMNEGAKLNWTGLLAASAMLPLPMSILTIDDKPFALADKNALMGFLMAVMAYDTARGSPVTSGRELRMMVEAAQTVEEVEAIVDDRE